VHKLIKVAKMDSRSLVFKTASKESVEYRKMCTCVCAFPCTCLCSLSLSLSLSLLFFFFFFFENMFPSSLILHFILQAEICNEVTDVGLSANLHNVTFVCWYLYQLKDVLAVFVCMSSKVVTKQVWLLMRASL
jgi:hypothetical protein